MRNIRSCEGITLETGHSECQVDFGRIKAIILVPHGKTLGKTFAPGDFEQKCHADVPNRIYPIKTVVEYAKAGGEPQVTTIGYGTSGVSGLSQRTDTFTLDRFYEGLAASLTKNMNKKFDAYYLDENGLLIGQDNGTDELGGIPMNTVYCNVTPLPTSSANANMTVSLVLENAREAIEKLDYVQLDFNPIDELNGLVPVKLVEVTSGKYQVIEVAGSYDRTPELGEAIASAATDVLDGASACTYTGGLLVITAPNGSTPALKPSSVLLTHNVAGIEPVATVSLP